MDGNGRTRPIWGAPLPAATLLLLIAEATWFGVNVTAQRGPAILGSLPVFVGAACAAGAFGRAWTAPGLTHSALRFWRTMTVASVIISVAQLTDLPGYLVRPTTRPNSVSLAVYLVAMLLVLTELYRLPTRSQGRGERLSLVLDSATVTLAALVVTWYTSLVEVSTLSASWQLLTTILSSTVLAVVVLALAKVVLSGGRTIDPRALRLLGVGLAAEVAGLFMTPLILDRPQIATEPLGRAVLYFCVAVGAEYQRTAAALPAAQRPRCDRRAFSWLPYVAVAVVDGFLVYAIRDEGAASVVIGTGAVALTGLVIARQLAAFQQNTRLVTEVRAYHDQLTYQATHDSLTDLANRSLFGTEAQRAIGRCAEGDLWLALIDLDDFKAVNDTFGHHVGDGLLTMVAQRLRAAIRPHDLVARLGGDEFAVLVEQVDSEQIETIIGRALAALAEPLRICGHDLSVRASIGVAQMRHGDDTGRLMHRADMAMYHVKAEGKGRFARFDETMVPRSDERARLAVDTERALECGEFEVHYQPIVALPHGSIVGVEALVRWRHPERGLLAPLEFIPASEQNGMIVPLGRWVLGEACQQAARWLREYPEHAPETVSVNVSPRQLGDVSIVEDIASALRDSGLPASRLIVEVTETAVVTAQAIGVIRMVRELGVRIALDDFGTGHSTLSLVSECPIDQLKLDRSFVDGVRGRQIAVAVAKIAEALELEAVAEGVESAGQVRHLHGLGYRLAQGFHFSRPCPAEMITERLAAAAGTATGGRLAARNV